MTTRVLPNEEWWKLEPSGFPVFPCVPFNDIDIVAVEEGEKVIGCATVFRATHLDGLWIDHEHRTPGVKRALMREVVKVAKEKWGTDWAFANASNERMERLLRKLGSTYIVPPGFVVPLTFGGK